MQVKLLNVAVMVKYPSLLASAKKIAHYPSRTSIAIYSIIQLMMTEMGVRYVY